MKYKGRYDKSIVCPFYRYADSQHIGCEGVCKGNTLSINFENPNEEKAYKDRHCRSMEGYRLCKVCEMLEAKYADDGK